MRRAVHPFVVVARAITFAALLLVLVAPVFAGTNSWTAPAAGCAASGVPDLGSALACHETYIDADVAASGGTAVKCTGHNVHNVNTSDVTPPINYTAQTTVYWDGTPPLTCVGPSASTANWSFTLDTGSGCEYDPGIHGCAVDPPEPPDCSDFDGVQVDRFFSDSEVGGAICAAPPGDEVTGCEALVASPTGFAACAGGQCFARVAFTGNQCGAEPDATGEVLVDEPGNTNCVAGGGVTVCAAQSSQNCGTVNGQSVCLNSIPPGRCTFLGNGGMVCASSASSPPAPTDSMGSSPATPDGSFNARGASNESGSDFNYFGPGTVASSGTPTSGPGTGGGGILPDEEGEDECTDCDFSAPSIGDAQSFGETTAAIFAGIESSPWGTAITAPVDELPAGACPEETFSMFGETYSIDVACDLWPTVEPILTACFLLVYVLIGIRIVASA